MNKLLQEYGIVGAKGDKLFINTVTNEGIQGKDERHTFSLRGLLM